MVKVVLVEDEYVVREGIKKIDWESHGYEFCGEASDGEMALPIIREYEPDIVITDIKMPFMDGLELAGRIRKGYPNIQIVILSGYEEFSYAKEAISLGVAKYLTKPIGANELLKELDEIKEGIEKKKLDKEPPVIESGDIGSIDRNRLFAFLKTGDVSGAERFADEFIDSIGDKALNSMVFRQYAVMDIYFAVTEFVAGLGYDKELIEAPDSSISNSGGNDSFREYCLRIISQVVGLRDSVSRSKYKDVVDKVIDYIAEHYSDEDLSLNILAEYVRFSTNHLSTIFSQQTGEPLSKYLIEYRIKKAKEELKCTSKKSSEIALDVGYRDPHYFSYMFKKITGMTPTQYRDGSSQT
jgi:two-component system response regulator YesN